MICSIEFFSSEIYINNEISSSVYTNEHNAFIDENSMLNITDTDTVYQNIDEGIKFDNLWFNNESYKNLIENCLSQDPNDRPTFNQITKQLATDKGFITENVQVKDFKNYISYINEYETSYDSSNVIDIGELLEQSKRFKQFLIYKTKPTKKKYPKSTSKIKNIIESFFSQKGVIFI